MEDGEFRDEKNGWGQFNYMIPRVHRFIGAEIRDRVTLNAGNAKAECKGLRNRFHVG